MAEIKVKLWGHWPQDYRVGLTIDIHTCMSMVSCSFDNMVEKSKKYDTGGSSRAAPGCRNTFWLTGLIRIVFTTSLNRLRLMRIVFTTSLNRLRLMRIVFTTSLNRLRLIRIVFTTSLNRLRLMRIACMHTYTYTHTFRKMVLFIIKVNWLNGKVTATGGIPLPSHSVTLPVSLQPTPDVTLRFRMADVVCR